MAQFFTDEDVADVVDALSFRSYNMIHEFAGSFENSSDVEAVEQFAHTVQGALAKLGATMMNEAQQK